MKNGGLHYWGVKVEATSTIEKLFFKLTYTIFYHILLIERYYTSYNITEMRR